MPFPGTCRFSEKLSLTSFGERYLGVVASVTMTAGCHREARWVSLSLVPVGWSLDFS